MNRPTVRVSVTNGTESKPFKAATAAKLLPAVFSKFGPGTVEDPDGCTLTESEDPLVEGSVYKWIAAAGEVHVKVQWSPSLIGVLPMWPA
jgi:hypothetical protein